MAHHLWPFTRHYLEMVAAMLAGMAGLALVSTVVDLTDGGSPELVEMAVWMTVPMVAWMRLRSHRWRATLEMTGAMLAPTVVAIAVLAAGIISDTHGLLMAQHIAMFPAMLVAMLLRREEYVAHRHGRVAVRRAE